MLPGCDGCQLGFLTHASGGRLLCPSGRILLGSLAQLGDAPWAEAIRVDPGVYELSLSPSVDQQLLHRDPESLDDYPAGDGPDWTVYLDPLA